MMTETRCDLVNVNGDQHEQCSGRAEFIIGSLEDVLYACIDHRGWALARVGDEAVRVDLLHRDEWPSGFPGLWTTRQAAEHWGVKPATYRDYISAGYAPAPAGIRDPVTGAKLHDAAAVRTAYAARVGRGHRSDLS